MGSSTLKPDLIRVIVWRLTPCVLYRLVEKFNEIVPHHFSHLLTPEARILSNVKKFAGLSEEETEAQKNLQVGFNNAIASLNGGDPQVERVMMEAHVIGLAVKQKVRVILEQIVEGIDESEAEEDCIVTTYLKYGIDIIHQALRMNMVKQQKTFHYYVPGECFIFIHKDTEPREPSDELLSNVQAQLADFFGKKYTSRLCEIVKGVYGTRYFLSITHAGPYMQDRKVTDEKPENFSFRPVEYDTIVFDLQTRDLCIHTEVSGRKGVVNEYIKIAGDLFFKDDRFWGKEEKYTLRPLKLANKKALREMLNVEKAKNYLSVPNGSLSAIRLPQIKFIAKMSNGTISSRLAKNSLCLSEELAADSDFLVPERYQLTEVVISFDYLHAIQGHKTASLSLTAQSKKFTESSEGVSGTDEWLNSLGFNRREQFHAPSLPDWFSKLSEEDKARFAPKRIADEYPISGHSTPDTGDLFSNTHEPS